MTGCRERRTTALAAAITAVVAEWPPSGSRRVSAPWPRHGWPVPHQGVGRLMGARGLQVPRQARTRPTTPRHHPCPRSPPLGQGRAMVRPAQVWGSDRPDLRLRHGCVDVAVSRAGLTRRMRGWQLGPALDPSLTVVAWPRALAPQTPASHHAEQGGPSAATADTQAIQEAGAPISRAAVGAAWQHGYAERRMRTMQAAAVPWSAERDDAEAVRPLGGVLTGV